MHSRTILDVALQQYDSLPAETTLVLVHPGIYQYQRPLTQRLLNTDPCVYTNLSQQVIRIEQLFHTLSQTMAEQADIHLPPFNSPAKAAATVAEAMNQHKSFTVLVDGYDTVDDKDADEFFVQLAQDLRPNHRVVICGRHHPLGILAHCKLGTRCTMLPNIPEYLLVDYSTTKPNQSVLEVRALGPSQAWIDGRLLDQWDGNLPKNLFYFLVNRAMTTRNEIFETFWPMLEKPEATNVFHVTKRKISEILGQDLTTYGGGFYHISDNIELYYDVVAFQEAVQNAEVAEDEENRLALYQQAVRLYRGPFLSTLDKEWIVEQRTDLQQIYSDALIGIGQILFHRGQQQEALGYLRRGMATTPEREDIARLTMQNLEELDRPDEALTAFYQMEAYLQKRYQVSPSPETIDLAESIRKRMNTNS